MPWKLIAGTRDKLIHFYEGMDLEEVWKMLVSDLPDLICFSSLLRHAELRFESSQPLDITRCGRTWFVLPRKKGACVLATCLEE